MGSLKKRDSSYTLLANHIRGSFWHVKHAATDRNNLTLPVAFEKLLSLVEGLTPNHQLGGFNSGLKELIHIDVQVACPMSITDAIGLSRFYEA